MRNYNITEEQIKKLSTQDQIVEEYLNKWFPEAFIKELEIGEWYKIKHHDCALINYQPGKSYGLGLAGLWCDNFNNKFLKTNAIEATDEEVKQALIKEAEKRGFKKGVEFTPLYSDGTSHYDSSKFNDDDYFIFDEDQNSLDIPGFRMFCKGIWAEIKNDPVTLNFQEIADKFGIDVEQLRISRL